jgi:DNA-directed RNA polymerase subunit RPC12/RpoP
MYKCASCGRIFEKLERGDVRCSHCRGRILQKTRSDIVHKVKVK